MQRRARGRSDSALRSRIGRFEWSRQLYAYLRELRGSALTQAIEVLSALLELLVRLQQTQRAEERLADPEQPQGCN